MFGLVFLGFWIAFHGYLAWHLLRMRAMAGSRKARLRTLSLVGLLALLFPVSRAIEADGLTAATYVLALVGTTWAGTLLLAVPCLLAVDVATLFGRAWRLHVERLRAGAFVLAGALSLVALVQGFRPPVVVEHEVVLPSLPRSADGTTLVLVSDLHLGATLDEDWLADRVEQIEALQADAVLLAGDVVEGRRIPLDVLAGMEPILRRLEPRLGTFAVAGNHDWHGTFDFEKFVAAAGIELLKDEWVELVPGLVLAGVGDHGGHSFDYRGAGRAERALRNRPKGAATLFLSHRPVDGGPLAQAGVALSLAGHTHGGQLWPYGFLAWLRNPYYCGRYDEEGLTTIVTRGLGTWGPRMRLWAPSEIVFITLRSGDASTN